MPKPQQPELRRSELQGFDPDATPTHLQGLSAAPVDSPGGPVPVDNLPGHHPEHEQDKPSGDDFVAKVKAKAAEAEAEAEAEAHEQDERATNGTDGMARNGAAPTQTSAPRVERPAAAVTPTGTVRPPAPHPAPPAWVKLAATLAGTPFRITAEVLKLIRRTL